MNALRLCVGLLTVLPVGLPSVERRDAGRAMLLAPLAALPMALLVVGAQAAELPMLVAAGLLLCAEAAFTRALHLDGLADLADGLGSGAPPERARAIMKQSDVGPFGVVTLVLTLLLQYAALLTLLPTQEGAMLAAVAWLVSRHALAWACRPGIPSASEGLGSLVAGTVPTWACLLVTAGLLGGAAVVHPWQGPLVVVLGLAGGLLVLAVARRRVGGITGDVLGAVVEVVLTVALVSAALVR